MGEKCGKCGRSGCDCECLNLPDSTKTFPDGAHYRIEVSGIETAAVLGAVIDEAKKQKIPVHRAIATVKGSKFYSNEDLMALAHLATKEKIEVIICPGDLANGFFGNPDRNLNFQNIREANDYVEEILRCARIGFRGFLVWTSPMLRELNKMRLRKKIPKDTIFKISTFANSCNLMDFRYHELDGANTVNAANGLTLTNFSEIRRSLSKETAIDVHITFWQNLHRLKGRNTWELATEDYNRIEDAPEIARVASPVYYKFEKGAPGISVYDVPRADWSFRDLAEHKRKDIRMAAIVARAVSKEYPYLKLSDWGPEDLRVPRVSFTGPVQKTISRKPEEE